MVEMHSCCEFSQGDKQMTKWVIELPLLKHVFKMWVSFESLYGMCVDGFEALDDVILVKYDVC
jgi:hypothetical protein